MSLQLKIKTITNASISDAFKVLRGYSRIELKCMAIALDIPPNKPREELISAVINATVQARLNSEAINPGGY
jgi:hypothetical protein